MQESFSLVASANPELPNVRNAQNALEATTLISTVHTTLQQLANREKAGASFHLQPLVNQMTVLQRRLTDWASTVPEEWFPSIQENSILAATEAADMAFPRIHLFHGLWVVGQ